MHLAIVEPIYETLDQHKATRPSTAPFSQGAALREPIFYNGESAYNFQFRDFATKKYAADNQWLMNNKGFEINSARDVIRAIGLLQTEKLNGLSDTLRGAPPEEWTVLPVFSFSASELSEKCGLDAAVVAKVLDAFTLPDTECNPNFCSLHDFNVVTASPLIRREDRTYILFAQYSLSEALYDSPFYWMNSDKLYRDTALTNRGRFCEDFARERLESVFGKGNVYSNVDIYESKDKKTGEIDVLVLFGNRAIVVQTKSKRLTIEARRGSDRQIKDDFQKSVQDSYNQGWKWPR
jgi:hypothetical protein